MNASLYIHVPFCRRKCDYCHFFVQSYSPESVEGYLTALLKEWSAVAERLRPYQIVSIYFGGGTPSLLGWQAISQLLEQFRQSLCVKELEITVETNPELVSDALVRNLSAMGVNRLSIGIQSLDDHCLKTLSRQHDAAEAVAAVYRAQRCGIENISIDLMYELPGQSIGQWEQTVRKACLLPITHLSLYNLTFEEGTLFFKRRRELQPALPSDEEAKTMLHRGVEQFQAHGLMRYEISAFARAGKRSEHNTGYWLGRPFIGLGPSAFSYWEGVRYRNVAHLKRYCQRVNEGTSPIDFEEKLTGEPYQRERLAIGLRLLDGYPIDALGPLPDSLWKDIHNVCSKGWAHLEDHTLKLTELGRDFYDLVATELV